VVNDFHGLSTMIEDHARAAESQFGKASNAIVVPVTTLKELCVQHAPPTFDFLKVDVEGAERDVLLNGDWQNYRPKVVVVEALAPYTLAPAWAEWEPFLAKHGYRYVWFDTLNRYYVAEEADELRAVSKPPRPPSTRPSNSATSSPRWPTRRILIIDWQGLLAGSAMTRLPLLERDLLDPVPHRRSPPLRARTTAGANDVEQAIERLFGPMQWCRGRT
jgi:methyltransferase, FkbM family